MGLRRGAIAGGTSAVVGSAGVAVRLAIRHEHRNHRDR